MWLRWDLNSRLRDTSPPLYWAKLLFIPCSDACHLKSRLLLAKSSITREKPVWISFKLLFNVPLTGFCFFFYSGRCSRKDSALGKIFTAVYVCLSVFLLCLFVFPLFFLPWSIWDAIIFLCDIKNISWCVLCSIWDRKTWIEGYYFRSGKIRIANVLNYFKHDRD